jgi:hypothetical protein
VGYGGATWDTAGTLEVGGGNTFDSADATTDEPFVKHPGWWTFTLAAPVIVRLTQEGAGSYSWNAFLYEGDAYADKVRVTEDDYEGPDFATLVYRLFPGTYHFVAGTSLLGTPPTTYQITYAIQPLAATAWQSDLRDRDDNVLIVSSGDLRLENPGPFADEQPWFYGQPDETGLIDTWHMPGRLSDYTISETLAGHNNGNHPDGASSCAWSHAVFGDIGNALWNASTTDTEDGGDPVCRPLFDGFADDAVNGAPGYSLSVSDYSGSGSFVAGAANAEVAMRSEVLYLLVARDNLTPFGVIQDDLDPLADGVPADVVTSGAYALEWESPYVELTKVEVTGDQPGRPDDGTVDDRDGLTLFLNDKILPSYTGLGAGSWRKGTPGTQTTGDPHEHLIFTYTDGDPTWNELAEFTSWDDCADYVAGDAPDARVGACIGAVLVGAPDDNTSSTHPGDIAVRLTLRSPRYRWVYEGTNTVPPRRIFGRSDGATHGAARALGGRNTVQSGNRTLGSIL